MGIFRQKGLGQKRLKFSPMKKRIILFSIVFLIITGCTKTRPVKTYKEIEFWTLQLSGFSGYINSVISRYEKLNPDIKIKWVDVPFSQGEKRALAAVLSKNVPDLINMNPDFGATLASKGALVDIKTLISKQEYENYLQTAWQASGIKEFIYGIPWYITSAVTLYNTELLNDSGVKKIPKTYSDLEPIAAKIKAKTGKYVLMPTLTENGKMLRFFNKYDIPIVNKARDKTLFNTPQAQEVLSFWKMMYTSKFIPAESITHGHRESLGKFQAGETAFIIAGANFLNIIKQNAPQVYEKLDVTAQLTGTSGKAGFSLMNLVIPKKSKHPKEALKFALFLTNANNQLEFCKLAPILPSSKHALASEYFTGGNTNDIIVKSRIISARQLQDVLLPVPALENRKELYEIIDYMAQEVMLGQKTSEEALNRAKKEWDKILKENWRITAGYKIH